MDTYYTVEQAAERLRISVRSVRRMVAQRRIAFVKMGRSVRLAERDLEEYVQERRVEPMTASDVWRDLRGVA